MKKKLFLFLGKFKVLIFLFFCFTIHFNTTAQVTVEGHFVLAMPFEPLRTNTNRDGIFGLSLGVYYKTKKIQKLSFGLQFRHLPYGEGGNFNLTNIDEGVFIAQHSKSFVQMQTLNGVVRGWLINEKKLVQPYIDCLIGFKRMSGYTVHEKGYFAMDTNADGFVDSFDDAINLEDFGITTSVTLPKAKRQLEHSQLTPSIGVGIGAHVKILKYLTLDTRAVYLYSPSTTYYDFGSGRILNNSAGIDGFGLVESEIAFVSISEGLTYTF